MMGRCIAKDIKRLTTDKQRDNKQELGCVQQIAFGERAGAKDSCSPQMGGQLVRTRQVEKPPQKHGSDPSVLKLTLTCSCLFLPGCHHNPPMTIQRHRYRVCSQPSHYQFLPQPLCSPGYQVSLVGGIPESAHEEVHTALCCSWSLAPGGIRRNFSMASLHPSSAADWGFHI